MTSSTYLTVPLASQVGGHLGVHTTEDGSLIFKPALLLELQFYQSALSDEGFVPLRPFIPRFYGTLRVEGKVDTTKATDGNIAISRIEDVQGVIRDKYHPVRCLEFRFSANDLVVLYIPSSSRTFRTRFLNPTF
jgi:hypothetical protein